VVKPEFIGDQLKVARVGGEKIRPDHRPAFG
jgi:hypothetical protein